MSEHQSTTSPQIEGIITKLSSSCAKRLVERLQEALRSSGFIIFAHINHIEKAWRFGLEMQE